MLMLSSNVYHHLCFYGCVCVCVCVCVCGMGWDSAAREDGIDMADTAARTHRHLHSSGAKHMHASIRAGSQQPAAPHAGSPPQRRTAPETGAARRASGLIMSPRHASLRQTGTNLYGWSSQVGVGWKGIDACCWRSTEPRLWPALSMFAFVGAGVALSSGFRIRHIDPSLRSA